jgi:hypothetical protein
MLARHNKSLDMLFGSYVGPRRSRNAHPHVEGFSALVKYLVKLRRDGTLNDEHFSELVKIASAAFIEAEISDRVESVLENKALDDLLLSLWK